MSTLLTKSDQIGFGSIQTGSLNLTNSRPICNGCYGNQRKGLYAAQYFLIYKPIKFYETFHFILCLGTLVLHFHTAVKSATLPGNMVNPATQNIQGSYFYVLYLIVTATKLGFFKKKTLHDLLQHSNFPQIYISLSRSPFLCMDLYFRVKL